MKGSILKDKLVASGYDLNEVAMRMGTSQNNLNNIFSLDSIPYNTLTEIAKATDKDVIIYEDNYTQTNNVEGLFNTLESKNELVNGNVTKNNELIVEKLLNIVQMQEEQIKRRDDQALKLIAIIEKITCK